MMGMLGFERVKVQSPIQLTKPHFSGPDSQVVCVIGWMQETRERGRKAQMHGVGLKENAQR